MVTDINIFGERNSGTNLLRVLLQSCNEGRNVSWYTKHAFPSIEQLTDCHRKRRWCPEGDPNILSDRNINVLISRNVFTWFLRMHQKRHEYDLDVDRYTRTQLLVEDFMSDHERLYIRLHPEESICQGPAEYFESFLPYKGVIDLRNKKYNRWLELLGNSNLVVLNYDKLISLDEEEFYKLQSVCNVEVDLAKEIQPNTVLESHYLNKHLIEKDFDKETLDILHSKIDWQLEEKLGYNYYA